MATVQIRAFRSLIASLVVWGLLLTRLAGAITIRVPQDYARIQDAILGATHGDVIVVSPGGYAENIHFLGKNVVLRSANPASSAVVATTIIDGSLKRATVGFIGSETSSCSLSGFTIRNGRGLDGYGGGICGGGTKARIERNVIANNSTTYGGGLSGCNGTIQNNVITNNGAAFGGGLYGCSGTIRNNVITYNSAFGGGGLYGCTGTVQNNVIINNSASDEGGGLCYCGATIQNNVITNNSARDGGGLTFCGGTIQNNVITNNSATFGGGLCECGGTIQNNVITNNSARGGSYLNGGGGGLSGCGGTIQNNVIANNSATAVGSYAYGGGLDYCNGTIRNNTIYGNSAQNAGGGVCDCSGVVVNCIIWGNTAPLYPQISYHSVPNYSCIQGYTVGGQGNIGSDPRFRSLTDFHLQSRSPCIDAGTNLNYPAFDKDGNRRPLDGNRDGRAVCDMGAYEFVPVTFVPLWQLYK